MNAVEDIDSMMIDRSKLMADGAKYFELFEKHIPTGLSGNVLIMSIGNLDCLDKIMGLNKDTKYTVVENSRIIKCLSKLFDGELDIDSIENNGLDLYNIIKELDMKFDCIIMNPPYQRNLHLKILAEAIKHLSDDGKCVNLSPVRWLQDPLAKYKKNCDLKRFEESIAKHIESLETITALQAQNIFSGTVMNIDLGVYACSKANTQFDYKDYYANPILNKCIEYIATHNPNIEADKQDGWRVRMPVILGGKSGGSGDRSKHHKYLSFGKLLMFKDGKNEEGKWWYDCYMHNQYTKTTPYITSSIKFDSKIEAENFINQFDTLFGKYITNLLLSDVHVAPIQVLWLADAVNLRTGKKGYISEWTDDDLYKFFNITPEEQKVIEETMEKYAAK